MSIASRNPPTKHWVRVKLSSKPWQSASEPTILSDVSKLAGADYIKEVRVHRRRPNATHLAKHYDLTIHGLRLLMWRMYVYGDREHRLKLDGDRFGMEEIAKKYSVLLPEIFASRGQFDELGITKLVDDCVLLAVYRIVHPDFEWEKIYRSKDLASRLPSIEYTWGKGSKTFTRAIKRTLGQARKDAHDEILNQFFVNMTCLEGVELERLFAAVKKSPRLREAYVTFLREEKRRLPAPYDRALNLLGHGQ